MEAYNKMLNQIHEWQSKKVLCPCGKLIRRDGLLKHRRTQKHRKFAKYSCMTIVEKGSARSAKSIPCPCGGRYVKKARGQHIYTARHLAWEQMQQGQASASKKETTSSS